VHPLAHDAVDALNDSFGRHEGFRAVHAKGTLCKGTFTATPEAARLSRAAHLQGDTMPGTARLSNGSGNPRQSDRAPDGRGLAVKVYLPDGSRTDFVSVTLPCFFVRKPEDFIKFTKATKRIGKTDLPGPRFLPFILTHREALPAVRFGLALKPVPSYANCRYNGIHSFKWVGPEGERWVRYSFVPEAGEGVLSKDEAKGKDRDFLQAELGERLAREPIRFTLELQLAEEGDKVHDPTYRFPESRERVNAGTLELTELETGREGEGDILVFDPTRVVDGVELSDDEILRFRSHAYSASVERRSGVERPAALG
jgi:catalase